MLVVRQSVSPSSTGLRARAAGRPVHSSSTVNGPEILINATDLSTGGRFAFNRFFFDPICSDLSRYRVALAVTASSAVPVC